jgi:hypothetical protein
MPSLATRRLIDASASLPPVERALLNLWVNRGLDDQSLAAMTGMTSEGIEMRRAHIVESLSAQLGLPPDQIQAALAEIAAASTDELARPGEQMTNGEHAQAPVVEQEVEPQEAVEGQEAIEGQAPVLAQEAAKPQEAVKPQGESSDTPEKPPETKEKRRPRAMLWAPVVVLIAIVVLVVLIASGSGGSSKHKTSTTAPSQTAVTSTAPAVTPTSPSPSPTVSRPPIAALGTLPGSLLHARGAVTAIGKLRHLRLKLSVTGLPPAVRGHYEVWLYNSVLDSQSLARLSTGVHTLRMPLPRDAHRYRWIDISFQPVGVVNHSGESVLRAANPVAQSKNRLKKPKARHRTLHQATGPPTHHPAKSGASARRSGSQRRRAARGSSKAKTSK